MCSAADDPTMHDSGAAFQDGYHEALRDVREGKEDARRAVDWPADRAECRYAGENRGWCLVHDAEWRIDRAVCEGDAPDRADTSLTAAGQALFGSIVLDGGVLYGGTREGMHQAIRAIEIEAARRALATPDRADPEEQTDAE